MILWNSRLFISARRPPPRTVLVVQGQVFFIAGGSTCGDANQCREDVDLCFVGKYPEVERIVRELAAGEKIPMPKVYYVDTPIPNAFATGRSPSHAVVAVT